MFDIGKDGVFFRMKKSRMELSTIVEENLLWQNNNLQHKAKYTKKIVKVPERPSYIFENTFFRHLYNPQITHFCLFFPGQRPPPCCSSKCHHHAPHRDPLRWDDADNGGEDGDQRPGSARREPSSWWGQGVGQRRGNFSLFLRNHPGPSMPVITSCHALEQGCQTYGPEDE